MSVPTFIDTKQLGIVVSGLDAAIR